MSPSTIGGDHLAARGSVGRGPSTKRWRLFHEANFRSLGGIADDQRARTAITKRPLKLDRFVRGVAHLQRFNLTIELQLIYGLPGETLASFRQSLNFAASLDPASLVVYPLLVLPGTELRKKATELNLDFDPCPPYHARSHFSMSRADLDYGRKIAEAVRAVGNTRTIRILGKEEGLTFANVIDAWIAWEGDRDGEIE